LCASFHCRARSSSCSRVSSKRSTSICCRAMYCACIFYASFHIRLGIDYIYTFPKGCSSFAQSNEDLLDYPPIIPYMRWIQRRSWHQHYSSWTPHSLIDGESLEVRSSPLPAAHRHQNLSSILFRITVISPSFATRYVLFFFSTFSLSLFVSSFLHDFHFASVRLLTRYISDHEASAGDDQQLFRALAQSS
jgi:hypothetical protein